MTSNSNIILPIRITSPLKWKSHNSINNLLATWQFRCMQLEPRRGISSQMNNVSFEIWKTCLSTPLASSESDDVGKRERLILTDLIWLLIPL